MTSNIDDCYTYRNFDKCACSISGQDCARLYPVPPGYPQPPFTSASCAQYPQWRKDDVGVCGWAGAPCQTDQVNNASWGNCSELYILRVIRVFLAFQKCVLKVGDMWCLDYNTANYCYNGICGYGLVVLYPSIKISTFSTFFQRRSGRDVYSPVLMSK